MSLNDILGSAASGLAAAQAGLRSVSNNIANVGTAGYARERTSLSTGVTGGRVNGVVVGEPTRIADRFLETNVYARSGDFGRSDVTSSYLDRLQALLGAPGAEGGLPARLDSITASAVAMTGSQDTQATAAAFTANVQDTIGSMRQLDGDVAGLRADAGSQLVDTVTKVNGLLARIHDLNGTISSLQGLGRGTSGAEDQRVAALGELSSLVAVTVRDQPDGRVAIDTASGVPLLDRRLRLLSLSSGGAGAQAGNSAIDIRFADAKGKSGAATGDSVDSPAIGGKLGGLLDLRDNLLPAFAAKLGTLFNGLAQTLNAASNASSTVPAPASLSGRATGLVATDRLGFTGATTFAVTKSDGTLVAKTNVDFSALGPNATIADAVAAINTGLGGSGTASFANGSLSITASAAGQGVVVGQDATSPSARGGVGFSHYFGLNDIVESGTATLTPSGMTAADPSGFAVGGQTDLVVRDASGRKLASYGLSPGAGSTFGDLVANLNASPLAFYGGFAIDPGGRLQFQPKPTMGGATLTAASDSTDRFGTGRSFSALMGVNGAPSGLATAQVKPAILADPGRLPLARLQSAAAIGAKAIGPGDTSGATRFVDQLGTPVDLGSSGTVSIDRFASSTLGSVGLEASQAQGRLSDATARRDDAVARRESFSGVNIDEELSQMVLLQNSYSAAARVMSTASSMYDTLLAMVR